MLSPIRLHPVVIVLIGAFALRAAAAIVVTQRIEGHRSFLIEGDANGYWELGTRIAHGQTYEVHAPPRRVMRMPGFPLVLAVCISLFGPGLLAARMLLAFVGTLGCWFVYLLARRFFDVRTATAAAGLCAVSPVLAVFSVLILSETLFAVCLTLSLIPMAHLLESLRRGRSAWEGSRLALLTGSSIALACYVRPSWLLAAPVCGLCCLIGATNRVHGLIGAAILVASTFACLAPWALRNQRAVGHPIFTTLWAGPSLYDGLNPTATGDSDMTFIESDRLYRAGIEDYEYRADRHYRSAALEFARQTPGRVLQLALTKLARFWSHVPNAAQFGGPWQSIVCGVSFLPLVAGALYGAWLCRDRPDVLLLTLGPVICFSAIHTVFVGSIRYRLPAEYPLWALAACGFCQCHRSLRS